MTLSPIQQSTPPFARGIPYAVWAKKRVLVDPKELAEWVVEMQKPKVKKGKKK